MKTKPLPQVNSRPYAKFSLIDGRHPLQNAVPDAFVAYPARTRHGGKLAFFNFALAKEMGLIPAEHPEQLNPELEKVIMQTFSIVIVNEYDQQHNLVVPPADRRPYPYMATRYLQLQHPSRQGKTSGDGRSVWNGTVTSDDGVVWDVSSCGTGATCLSPAANINHKFYKTGDPSISYGCGLSDLDEGLEALFFSEVMHQNKIPTERLLAVISFPGSTSINVRAYPNLLRPSHFLRYLKQGNFLGLKRMADYYIARQVQNKVWPQVKGRVAYDYLLARFARDFARASAIFEDEYIFCWIDWDGDNILMDGGIIDYGSVRQFGLFHHEYRYDDVQRYSTNILEQRQKARELVQNFAQLVDFLKTGKKKPLAKFKRHPALKLFDEEFEAGKDYNLLYRIGLEPAMIKVVLAKHKKLVHHLRPIFTHFERTVSQRGTYKVSDGITSDAVFSMRDLLRELPQMYMALDYQPLAAEDFLTLMRSSYARRDDLQLSYGRQQKIKAFQKYYQAIIAAVAHASGQSLAATYLKIGQRSLIINRYERVTGNAILYIIDKILHARPHFTPDQIYLLAQDFALAQNLRPEDKVQLSTLPRKYQITSTPRPGSPMVEGPALEGGTPVAAFTPLKTTGKATGKATGKLAASDRDAQEAQKRCRSYLDQILTIVRQNREGI